MKFINIYIHTLEIVIFNESFCCFSYQWSTEMLEKFVWHICISAAANT